MKVLVSGDRKWGWKIIDDTVFVDQEKVDYLWEQLDLIHSETPISVIIEGCAKGADSWAEEWATSRKVEIKHYPAKWDSYGRAAGPRRNIQMLDDGQPDLIVAFHPDLSQSRGTRHMVEIAAKAGLPLYVFSGSNHNKITSKPGA